MIRTMLMSVAAFAVFSLVTIASMPAAEAASNVRSSANSESTSKGRDVTVNCNIPSRPAPTGSKGR